MPEIWGDADDSFTKWLWNCDNVLVRVEQVTWKFRIFQKLGGGGGGGVYPK